MTDEKKKISGGVIAAICAVVIAVVVAVVVVVINVTKSGNIVGSYSLTSVVDSEGKETQAADAMKMLGADYVVEFKDDKTGTFTIKMDASYLSDYVEDPSTLKSETTMDFTYDDKKLKLSYNGMETEVDYEYKDGVLTMDYNGQKMKFKKA